jgi:hypothetical protein
MASLDQMRQWGMGLLVLGIMFGVGLAVLTDIQPQLYSDTLVEDDAYSPSTPLPSNFTVSPNGQGLVENSETLVLYDSSAGTNTTLDAGTDYTAYYDEATFEVQNTSATTDYDSSTDSVYVDYEYETEGEAYSAVGDTIDAISEFTGWFGLIVLVIVAAIIIRIVTNGFGSAGQASRYGKGRA